MKRILAKLTYANVMATVALFIALGGASYAAFKLPRNSVGAKQLKRGAVTPAKLSRASVSALTASPGAPGATGKTGPQGPAGLTGPQGPKGDPGIPATSLLASVSAKGKLLSGSGVTEAGRVEKAYEVKFDRDVSNCIYQVQLGRPGALGFTSAYTDGDDGTGVVVETGDQSGPNVPEDFYLAVFCP